VRPSFRGFRNVVLHGPIRVRIPLTSAPPWKSGPFRAAFWGGKDWAFRRGGRLSPGLKPYSHAPRDVGLKADSSTKTAWTHARVSQARNQPNGS